MISKRIIGVLISVALIIPALPASALTVITIPSAPKDSVNVTIDELVDGNWDSRREAVNFDTGEQWACPNMPYTSGPCDFETSKLHFYGSNLLPMCESSAQENCIESLTMEDSAGTPVSASFIGYAGGNSFPAVKSLGIYQGSPMSLWNVPGVTNAGGTSTYSIMARSRQSYDAHNKAFTTISLDASVIPYVEKSGDYKASSSFQCGQNGKSQLCDGKPVECAWTDAGKCGVRTAFGGTPKVTLKLRISNEIGGWFRGRLKETDIAVKKFSTSNSVVTVAAKPVQVARFAAQVKRSEITPKGLKALEGGWTTLDDLFMGGRSAGAFSTDGWNNKPYIFMDEFRTQAKDTADSVSSLWNFEAIGAGQGNKCLADTSRVLGIVTTNATAYDGTAPEFKSGMLTYRVGGMHYLPGGTDLSLGTYDLMIRSDVARCLYGFSKAPLSATVSVINDKGGKTVATTVVNETKDGWLKLAAYGFTFSKKTIKVKITKKKK